MRITTVVVRGDGSSCVSEVARHTPEGESQFGGNGFFPVREVVYFALFKRLWHISLDGTLLLSSDVTFPECFALVFLFCGLKSVLFEMILALIC